MYGPKSPARNKFCRISEDTLWNKSHMKGSCASSAQDGVVAGSWLEAKPSVFKTHFTNLKKRVSEHLLYHLFIQFFVKKKRGLSCWLKIRSVPGLVYSYPSSRLQSGITPVQLTNTEKPHGWICSSWWLCGHAHSCVHAYTPVDRTVCGSSRLIEPIVSERLLKRTQLWVLVHTYARRAAEADCLRREGTSELKRNVIW